MSDAIVEQIAANRLTALLAMVTAGTAVSASRLKTYGQDPALGNKTLVLLQGENRPDTSVTNPSFGAEYREQDFVVICPVKLSDSSADAIDKHLDNLVAAVAKKLREDISCGGLANDLVIGAVWRLPEQRTVDGKYLAFRVLYRVNENDWTSQ